MFQINQLNYIDNNNFLVIDLDEDIEEDIDLNDLNDYGINEQQRQQNVQDQAARTQVRMPQGGQLERLGEGRVHFSTTEHTKEAFQKYKNGIATFNTVQLEQHQQPVQEIVLVSTTAEKKLFNKAEVDAMIRTSERRTTYDIYLKLEAANFDKEIIDQIKDELQLTESTIKNIRKRKENGEDLAGKTRGRPPGTGVKVTVETLKWIKKRIDGNPTITIRELEKELYQESQESEEMASIKRSGLCSLIAKMGYSRKRITKTPINRNLESAMKKRCIWGKTFIELIGYHVQWVFIDECGFSRGQVRNYGYSEIGKGTDVTVDKIRHPNHTVIAAMIIGKGTYLEIIQGACTNARFQEFSRNLVHYLKQNMNMAAPLIAVMDNARIHVRDIHKIFWDDHIYLFKTIPYSPQLNSIELAFSKAKKEMADLYGSDILYAEKVERILKQRVEHQYQQKYNEIVRMYGPNRDTLLNDYDIEDGQTVDINQRRFQQKLDELDTWKENEIIRCERSAEDVFPTEENIDEELFEALIVESFKSITIENTNHYFGRTIKVADSCIHGYPLVNYKQFYHDYVINDRFTRELCNRYLNQD